jgi:aminoglycoside phosphotransferase (APT) family kinase protein
VAPRMADVIGPLLVEPWPIVDALSREPHTFVAGDWKLGNLGSLPDGRTILLDWALPGSGPPLVELAHYLALNSTRTPEGHSKEDTIAVYRGALERNGIDTEPWFDRQLALVLAGVMVMLGWEKALGDADELAWWEERVLAWAATARAPR